MTFPFVNVLVTLSSKPCKIGFNMSIEYSIFIM